MKQYPQVIYLRVIIGCNVGMDKHEKRRVALKALVDSLGRGGIAAVAARIGKEPNYVSRMLYPPGKEGRKRIGEDSADALVAAYPEWFGEIERGAPQPSEKQYEKAGLPTPNEANEPAAPPWPSKSLIDRYQAASDASRAAVDLILLPIGERESLGPEIRLAFEIIEKQAEGVLQDRKTSATKAA